MNNIPKKLTDKLRNQLTEAYCQEREVRFWGSDYQVTPELLPFQWGDGLQVVAIQPLATRPNWYVTCVDSSHKDLNSDEWYDLIDDIEECLEDHFLPCECDSCLKERGEELTPEERDSRYTGWPHPCDLGFGVHWWSIDMLREGESNAS
jgi:hypothetical protein